MQSSLRTCWVKIPNKYFLVFLELFEFCGLKLIRIIRGTDLILLVKDSAFSLISLLQQTKAVEHHFSNFNTFFFFRFRKTSLEEFQQSRFRSVYKMVSFKSKFLIFILNSTKLMNNHRWNGRHNKEFNLVQIQRGIQQCCSKGCDNK